MSDLTIYNCHIHTFTSKHVPRNFLVLICGPIVGTVFSWFLGWKWFDDLIVWLGKQLTLSPRTASFKRYPLMLATGDAGSQAKVFDEIQKQYPPDTVFITLPMDMAYMQLGPVPECLEQQHADLLTIARQSGG